MSPVELIISGCITWLAMIGFFALLESGELVEMRKRVAEWLQSSSIPVVRPREESLQPERERT